MTAQETKTAERMTESEQDGARDELTSLRNGIIRENKKKTLKRKVPLTGKPQQQQMEKR